VGRIKVLRVPLIWAREDQRGVAELVTAGFNAINSVEGGGLKGFKEGD
jgi:hypothetical protein